MRYRLTIEYDGTPFYGWQSQRDGGAVQDAINAAIIEFCGETVTAFGAGRTDTGVHARGQVAHLDLETGNRDAAEAGLRKLRVFCAACVETQDLARALGLGAAQTTPPSIDP